MYELKKIGKVVTSKFVGTGPSSYKTRIYRAAVSQRLRNTGIGQQSPFILKYNINTLCGENAEFTLRPVVRLENHEALKGYVSRRCSLLAMKFAQQYAARVASSY